MVLKKSKLGLNTGCSLKLGRYRWEYRNLKHCQGIIIKIYIGPEKEKDAVLGDLSVYLDDGGIEAQMFNEPRYNLDYVYYSLNKHQRWELADVVKQTIDWKQHLSGKDYGLTLVEREIFPRNFRQVRPDSLDMFHWLINRNSRAPWFPWKLPDCTSYHDNRNDIKHSYPNKNYSYQCDLGFRGDYNSLKFPVKKWSWFEYAHMPLVQPPKGLRKRGVQRDIPLTYKKNIHYWDYKDPRPWTLLRWYGKHTPGGYCSRSVLIPGTEDMCEVRYEIVTPHDLCACPSLTSKWKSNWNHRVIQAGAVRKGDSVRKKKKSLTKMKGMKRKRQHLIRDELKEAQF